VLRVDADLRKAPAPTSLAAETRDFERGLHGFLVGDGNWRDSIGTVASRHGDHDLIVTGDGLQPEALSGERMSRFLKEARQHYDFILLDCPSFPFVSDALVLAGNAHAVLSVFRLQHSSRERAREHLQGLAGSAAHGILVNDAGTKPTRAPKFTPRSASSPPGQKRLERAHAGRSMRWAAAALAFALMTGLLYSSVGSETLARFRPLFVNPPWIE
jgi:Mrp family chromosome partitioning ATPase